MTRLSTVVMTCGLLALCAGTARAQSSSQPWEKGSIQIGGFITSSDTEMRVNSSSGAVGAVVNVEDTLGVGSEKSTYRVDGFYRFGETRRHQIDLHYFDSRRSASKVLDRTIDIGDTTFPVGATVSTEFNLQFVNVDYSYAFFQDDRVRLSVAGGLHTTGVKFKVDSPPTLFEDESFTAPLPVVGLRGEVIVTERWRLKGSADAFYLEYDQFTGLLADTSLAVEYLPFKHAAFGLAVNNIRMNVESDGDNAEGTDLNGELKFNFVGLLMYARYLF
ncbi:MAG TPA: hypothetical protein VN664_15370 [Burkholderiales bacterium]|nr:hypothetical protein [Burkholderiales bacterium]